MGFNLNDLTIDQSVSNTGVWVDYYGGSQLKLRSMNSRRFKAELARLVQAHRLQLDASNPDHAEHFRALEAEALASEILVDWKGIDGVDPKTGKTIENVPYTKELGLHYLTVADKFRQFVSENAGRESLFKAKMVEETTGN